MRIDHCDHFHESRPAYCGRCGGAFEAEVLRPPPGRERPPAPYSGEWCVECHADYADLVAGGWEGS